MLCDNALEWSKGRLYETEPLPHATAQSALCMALLASLKLLAPIMPHVTEAIYQQLFVEGEHGFHSIHTDGWPSVNPALVDPACRTDW